MMGFAPDRTRCPIWHSTHPTSNRFHGIGVLGNPAGQRGGLPHPGSHLRLVELVAFVDVDVARVFAPARTRWHRSQRRAAEARHLEVVREGVLPQETTLALDGV